jgi:hypothetical protein
MLGRGRIQFYVEYSFNHDGELRQLRMAAMRSPEDTPRPLFIPRRIQSPGAVGMRSERETSDGHTGSGRTAGTPIGRATTWQRY